MSTKPVLAAILSVSSTSLTDDEKHFFAQTNPLGISLFNRNIDTPAQLKALIKEIKETIGRPNVLIAIDQEGGRVRRLKEPDYPSYAGQQTIGRLYTETSPETAKEACRLHAALISRDLHSLGINLNYAPVLDLCHPDTSPALSSRCFSSSPDICANLGGIMVETYLNNNIIPCIKHLPGHGRAVTDPHLNLPVVTAPLQELEADFAPFKKLKNTPCGMTAHIVISAIDPETPVTQSPAAIRFIRNNIGFNGFLISDALDMHALKGTMAQKAQTTLNAGCDAVCYCGGNLAEMRQIADTGLFLSEKALERFQKLTKIFQNPVAPVPTLPKENITKYQELIGKIIPYEETYDSTEVLFRMTR